MEVAISFLSELLAECIVAPIRRQVSYLTFHRGYFHQLEDQINRLKEKREMIQHRVDDEIRNGCEIEAAVLVWMEKAEEIVQEAENLLESSYRVKAGCSGLSSSNIIIRRRLSKRAREMSQYCAHIREEGMFDTISYRLPLRVAVDSTFASRRGGIKFESREAIQNDILEAIRDPEVSSIGIYGLGGVGKTTLVREVARTAMEQNLFDTIVMATVSANPRYERIQDQIADMLGMKFYEETLVGRAYRLRERIRREKYVLIVLDDIWKKLDLETIGIPFGDNGRGCKVLLTSRNQDVLERMGTQRNFKLQVLNEGETRSLFEDTAGDIVKDPRFRYTAIQVAKRLEGIPYLAVVIAKELKNRDLPYWKDALKQVQILENEEMSEKIHLMMELSYNLLDDDEVKALFLLCGVIGQISISELLIYIMGLRLFEFIDTVEDARNRLHRLISALKASCLLLEDGTSTHISMHPIVREVALSIASRDQVVFTTKGRDHITEWPREDFLRRCTQCIIDPCYIQQLPERLDCPELKILCLNSANNCPLEIPDSFFQGMKSLQVLNLRCMNISSLPTSFCSLIKLKTLCLNRCSLDHMVEIEALKNLEILSLKQSSMTNLPSEIGQLSHLRMLDLSGCEIEVFPPNVISKLNKLEELYMGKTSIKWELGNSSKQDSTASLAELEHLPNLTVLEIQVLESRILPREMLENLVRYNIVVGDGWEWSDSKYGISRTLKLKLHTSIHLEYGINELIHRVEDLYLDEINGISNVLYELNEGGFPLLKHLHIQNNAKIQHVINSVDWNQVHACFPNLETLTLHSLNNLEKICHGPVMFDSFRKLTVIKIQNCDRLKNLFSFSMFKALSQLIELEVSNCNSLKEIVNSESEANIDNIVFGSLRSLILQLLPQLLGFFFSELTSSKTSEMPLFNAKVEFPRLETVKLNSINIKKIFEDQFLPKCIGNLSSLIVEDCSNLKYLFSSILAEKLLKLKRLEIIKCHMDEIIKATERTQDSTEAGFANLEILKLSSLKLKSWDKNSQISANYFINLTRLIVEDCHDVKYLFTSFMIGSLSKLKHLEVSRCDMMDEILRATEEGTSNNEVVLFPNLETILISDMKNLKTLWQWHQPPPSSSFGRMKRMEVRNCEKLVTIFSLKVS